MLLGLLLATTALAGCLETAPVALVGQDGQITAMQAANHGEDVALEWQDDAELLALGAIESTESKEPWFHSNASTWNMSADPNVGDGEAPAWGLAYVSESTQQALGFVVWANGNITHRQSEDYDGDDEPLRAWEVDSDDALEAARSNATFRDLEEGMGEERTYTYSLFQMDDEDRNESADEGPWKPSEEGTVWMIMVWGGGSSGGMAFVDATTGDVLWVMDWSSFGGWGGWGSWSGWGGSWGGDDDQKETRTTHQACYEGRLESGSMEVSYELPVADGATHAAVGLEAEKDLATDSFGLSVEDAEGNTVEQENWNSGSGTSISYSWNSMVDPGNYTVTLTLGDASVGVDYTLGTWAGEPGHDDTGGYGEWGGSGGWYDSDEDVCNDDY